MDEQAFMSGFDGTESTSSETAQVDSTGTPSQVEQGSQVEGQPNTNGDPGQQSEQLVKLRFNHEDKEVPLSEAIQLAQQGMNYSKLQEKLTSLESDPRLAFVERLASENNMSIEDFINAFEEERTQAEIDELVQASIPKEYAEEMVKNRQFREQLEAQQNAQQQEQMQQQENLEFFEQFKALHGREFDAQNDIKDIPQEVWQMNEQGIPLKFAYLQHFANQVKTENAQLKQNQINSDKSPVGSVTAFGSHNEGGEDEFLIGFNSV
jgi:hypothetical protein